MEATSTGYGWRLPSLGHLANLACHLTIRSVSLTGTNLQMNSVLLFQELDFVDELDNRFGLIYWCPAVRCWNEMEEKLEKN